MFEKLWGLSPENLSSPPEEFRDENWLHTYPEGLVPALGSSSASQDEGSVSLLPSIIHVLVLSLFLSLTHVYNKTFFSPKKRKIECLHITPSLFMQINLGRNWPVISLGVFCGNLAA